MYETFAYVDFWNNRKISVIPLCFENNNSVGQQQPHFSLLSPKNDILCLFFIWRFKMPVFKLKSLDCYVEIWGLINKTAVLSLISEGFLF